MSHSNGAVAEPPAWFFDPDNQFSAPPPATNKATGPATEPALMPRFKPFTFKDMMNRPVKEWIIENVMGAGDKVMIYGPSGCGKTFVVIDIIFSACLGKQFAMQFDVARPLNVAYASGEGNSGIAQRFQAAAIHYGVEDLPNFTFYELTPQLVAKESAYASAADFAKEWQGRQAKGEAQQLDIFIIDTFHSAIAGADENSSQDMGLALHAIEYITRTLGCTVIIVHHTNKAGTGERGSGALRAAMDTMLEIKRTSEHNSKAILHADKVKDGVQWKDKTFDLAVIGDSVRVWWDEPSESGEGDKRKSQTGREILEILSKFEGSPLTAKHIGEAIDTRQQVVNKVLARIEKDSYIIRDKNTHGAWCYTITNEGKNALRNPNNPI
jgi:predicted transcriptional regulator